MNLNIHQNIDSITVSCELPQTKMICTDFNNNKQASFPDRNHDLIQNESPLHINQHLNTENEPINNEEGNLGNIFSIETHHPPGSDQGSNRDQEILIQIQTPTSNSDKYWRLKSSYI